MANNLKYLMDSVIENFDISITTGYAGHLASDLLYSSKNYISSINETVAVDFAHVFSYLGKRSLLIMKNAGLNEAFLPIANSCIIGTNAGMVLWIIDDLDVEGSEICQDSLEIIKLLGIKPKKPKNWNELYRDTREGYVISEKNKIPQILILSNVLFKSKISFKEKKLINECKISEEISVLHPKTADHFMKKFNKNSQIKTKVFPIIKKQNLSSNKLTSEKYKELFHNIKKEKFDLIIGDFGTYTLAQESPIQYGLHYGGAIASGIGASLAGEKTLVFVGEGGMTAGFEAVLEIIRKKSKLKIILIENNGISDTEPIDIDLVDICNKIGIPATRINRNEVHKISSLLNSEKTIIAVKF